MLSMDDDEAQACNGADTPGAAGAGRGGRNPAETSGGAESSTATAGRTKAEVATEALMEQVVERGNMWAAYERVLRNKGAPGPDGLRVQDLKAWLQAHWPTVKMLMKQGLARERAWRSATNGRGAWWNAGASHMNHAFTKSFFDRMGLVSLVDTRQRFQCSA